MLHLPSPPPAKTTEELDRVRAGFVAQGIPPKQLDQNLLIATWNIRAFGDLTEKWQADEADTPKRDMHAVAAIAEVVSHFDVIAIQEARENLKALRHMLKMLGPEWGLILTDVNQGPRGNGERLAFVYDTRRVRPSGLAGELVVYVDPDQEEAADPELLQEQFARSPYAVSFISGDQTFILVTLHVVWGDAPAERLPELRGIADWLAAWATRTSDEYNQNLIALGDFNIETPDDETFAAFTSRGLAPAPELQDLPRTIFETPTARHFYDQIAWFTQEGRQKLTLEYSSRAGQFDFVGLVYPELDEQALSWRLSDHYPLWAEFRMPHLGAG
jgi:endonuclease/exonuclease/phosphatase family metal-dependent hydrolase